jgi:hypothetical protein
MRRLDWLSTGGLCHSAENQGAVNEVQRVDYAIQLSLPRPLFRVTSRHSLLLASVPGGRGRSKLQPAKPAASLALTGHDRPASLLRQKAMPHHG